MDGRPYIDGQIDGDIKISGERYIELKFKTQFVPGEFICDNPVSIHSKVK